MNKMVKFPLKFAFATSVALFTLGAIDLPKTQAASLQLGLSQYVENIQISSSKSELEEDVTLPLAITRRNTLEENSQLSTAQAINQHIAERYYNLVEKNADSIGLIEGQKLLKEHGFLEDIYPENSEQITSLIAVDSPWIGNMLGEGSSSQHMPRSILYSLILIFGMWCIPTLSYICKKFIFGEEGIIEDLQNKFGKPSVPEGTIFLHERAFKDIEKIACEVGRLNSDKFSNKEFLLFVRIQQSIENKIEEYQVLNSRAELLKVAIAAQSSFLRIEQTELRFRSRHQQEFYQFVVNSLNQHLDKAQFRDQVKRKLAEVIPLLNTEEGRNALQSYLKEIDKISKHKLGLKLLSLFKEYQLADFTILKRVSDIVDRLKGTDLFAAKQLVSFVINDYEVFEKLGPIIGVSESESSPETYANVLQHIGLISRHEKAYEKFQQLLESLKKWQQPYKNIEMIRQEYQASEYRLPQEFLQEIPGLNIYKKYDKFLEND